MSRRADEAVALARRTAAELPPQAELLLAALESIELSAPLFGASEPVTPERFARHRRLPLAPGLAPKLLAASPRTSGPTAAARPPSARRWRWPRWRTAS